LASNSIHFKFCSDSAGCMYVPYQHNSYSHRLDVAVSRSPINWHNRR